MCYYQVCNFLSTSRSLLAIVLRFYRAKFFPAHPSRLLLEAYGFSPRIFEDHALAFRLVSQLAVFVSEPLLTKGGAKLQWRKPKECMLPPAPSVDTASLRASCSSGCPSVTPDESLKTCNDFA